MKLQGGEYVLEVRRGEQPSAHLLSSAGLLEAFGNLKGRRDEDGEWLCIGVGRRSPTELVVVQKFTSYGGAFAPGLLIVSETGTLFVGAGTRLLAYDLNGPARLWEDAAEHGFFAWDRVGGVVLMSAELELAAYDTKARKLWTTFVEPPWRYTPAGDQLELDVMGKVSRFAAFSGPEKGTRQAEIVEGPP